MKRTLITIALMATCLLGAYAQKQQKKNKGSEYTQEQIDSIVNESKKVFAGGVTVEVQGTQITPAIENGHNVILVNKVRKASRVARKVAGAGDVAGTAMVASGLLGKGVKAVTKGISMWGKANQMRKAADITDLLGGKEAHDLVFDGAHSSVSIPLAGQDVKIMLKFTGDSQLLNPTDYYRIVRMDEYKGDRYMQYMEFDYSLIKSEQIKKGGYVEFMAKMIEDGATKEENDIYLLTIPAEEALAGEYALVYQNAYAAANIGLAACTFSLK